MPVVDVALGKDPRLSAANADASSPGRRPPAAGRRHPSLPAARHARPCDRAPEPDQVCRPDDPARAPHASRATTARRDMHLLHGLPQQSCACLHPVLLAACSRVLVFHRWIYSQYPIVTGTRPMEHFRRRVPAAAGTGLIFRANRPRRSPTRHREGGYGDGTGTRSICGFRISQASVGAILGRQDRPQDLIEPRLGMPRRLDRAGRLAGRVGQ
jgi:hypothetical protein